MRQSTLKSARVLIVGGSSGIGLAVAHCVTKLGAHAHLIARSSERLEEAKAELGKEVCVTAADMAQESEIRAAVSNQRSIDHLVITAGEFRLGTIRTTSADRMRSILDDRFWGTYNAVRFAAPRMPATGSITLTSGVLGWRPAPGGSVTAAAVAATEAFCRVAALELAPIRVNTVCPGLVDTPMLDELGPDKAGILSSAADKLPVGRIGQPLEVAEAYVYLMTSPFITGTVLRIDGGAGVV